MGDPDWPEWKPLGDPLATTVQSLAPNVEEQAEIYVRFPELLPTGMEWPQFKVSGDYLDRTLTGEPEQIIVEFPDD
jgi:hypothetical protein